MSDLFRRATIGDPINGIPAELYNLLIEVAKDFKRRQASQRAGAVTVPSKVEFHTQNESGDILEQYSVVRLGDPLVNPSGRATSFFGDTVFETAAPVEGGAFGIMQEPAIEEGLAKTLFDGVTYVKVAVDDISHGYAACISGEYTRLQSQVDPGPATILWADTDITTQLDGAIDDNDTEFTVDSLSAFPDVPFVVRIGDELIEITEIDDDDVTILDCERGINGTTAASHADNAEVVFVSGTVWALVNLSSSGAATSSVFQWGITQGTITARVNDVLGTGFVLIHTAPGGAIQSDQTPVRVYNLCDEIPPSWIVHIHTDRDGTKYASPRCAYPDSSAENWYCMDGVPGEPEPDPITVDCCEEPVPFNLTLTIAGGTSCDGVYPMAYVAGNSRWETAGAVGSCDFLGLACIGGEWSILVGEVATIAADFAPTCDPFSATFSNAVGSIGTNCGCTGGSGTITVSAA